MNSDAYHESLYKKGKNDSLLAHFSDALKTDFSKEQVIVDGHQDPDGVYLIKKGFVKAYSGARDGNGRLLLVHKPGEFIPLPWALGGEHIPGLFYQAMSKVSLLRTSKEALRKEMGNNSWLAQDILQQAVNIITIYTQRIQTLELRSARERIIAELLFLAKRFGKRSGAKIIIKAPLTHQDIADSVNVTRETASKALEGLFKEGLIAQEERQFEIYDFAKLQAAIA